jgi:DNA-binding transcriptional MocR family regulator
MQSTGLSLMRPVENMRLAAKLLSRFDQPAALQSASTYPYRRTNARALRRPASKTTKRKREAPQGLVGVTNIKAGLCAVGFLRNGMSSRQAESAAMSHGIEIMALDRFMLSGTDPRGITMGIAAFDHRAIKRGIASLALALAK